MELGDIAVLVSVVMALAGVVSGIIAFGRSSRQTESQVISVTVEAAENVIELVTAQLDRSVTDYNKLTARLDKVEADLAEEKGKTLSLNMQLGKMRKRVKQLEDFIKEQGWTPPPPDDEST
jgi:peptidoglycan hydrolase CwlO-like protein